jgi:chromosome segregation ATPase
MEEKLKAYFPWIAAAVALFLLIALLIVGLLCNRGISANRASTRRIAADLDRLNDEMAQAGAEIQKLETAIEQANAEVVELKADLEKADVEGDRLREDLREDLAEDISASADRLRGEAAQAATQVEFQVLLLKASAKALKARIHLAEKEAGLAERDLAECDATLEEATALADEKAKVTLQEIRKSIIELKEGVEARTFPLATLEIVSDKIDGLIGK